MHLSLDRAPLARRTLLKGVGASLALPVLEAMTPARASGKKPPVRLAFFYMPNGVNTREWTPQGEGTDFQLSSILQSLAPLKDRVCVLENLWNKAAVGGDGHYVKTSGLLTGTTITKTTGADLRSGGVSVDQVLARATEGQTKLPSIELGIDPITSGVDSNVGYTRLYGSHISWKSSTTPLPCEIQPRLAFNRLFRDGSQLNQNRSVLDLVSEQARGLRGGLGAADQRKLDEYLESIRTIEKRIEQDERNTREAGLDDPRFPALLADLDRRIGDFDRQRTVLEDTWHARKHRDPTEQVRLMLDILAAAFWSDTTRAATFMFSNDVSGRNFSFVPGVSGSHHELSHHEGKADKLAAYARINEWHVAQWAYFLQKVSELPDAHGSVLDNSLFLFGSSIRDGNAHDPKNLPLVLAGRGGGAVQTGRRLVCPKETPLANLYQSLLQVAGAPVERFADSTGPLRELLA
jgi:hypothetical protein